MPPISGRVPINGLSSNAVSRMTAGKSSKVSGTMKPAAFMAAFLAEAETESKQVWIPLCILHFKGCEMQRL